MADIGVIVPTAVTGSLTAVATAVMAVFAWRTWKLSDLQHKLYNDPELMIHPWPEAEMAGSARSLVGLGFAEEGGKPPDPRYVQYQVALVNPGSVAITVTEVGEYRATPGASQQVLPMQFTRPPARPPGVFMFDVPWVIPGRTVAICSRWLSLSGEYDGLTKKDFGFSVTWRYHNGQHWRTVTHDPPLRWGFGEDYPGQRAGIPPA
jgi:hypothetical protein